MANTTTLNLEKVDGSAVLKNFPTPHNLNLEKIDDHATDVNTHLSKIDADLAYVAVKSGQNWQLPSGKSAAVGDYICVNGVLGNATAAITGGSTNIVEGTNWSACSNGGFNSIHNEIKWESDSPISNLTFRKCNHLVIMEAISWISPINVSIPSKFCPSANQFFITELYNTGPGRLLVNSNGTVTASSNFVGTFTWYV